MTRPDEKIRPGSRKPDSADERTPRGKGRPVEPEPVEEFWDEGSDGDRDTVTWAAGTGFLGEPDTRTYEDERRDADYFGSYADPGVHRLMVGDRPRTDAYRRAIEEVVRPGMRVLDVGTGSGILALFAARAGAEVIAVDESAILDLARGVAEDNGYGEKIWFHRGRVEDLSLSKPVDLIVSEWMGFFALAECMFRSVLVARDRHMAPGGHMLPRNLKMFLAPVEDSRLHSEHGAGLWERPVYGFDFRAMYEHELESLLTTAVDLKESSLIGPPATLLDIDLDTALEEDFFFDSRLTIHVERDARLHGFGGWFETQLSPGIPLATSPFAPQTHWRQSYFPVRPFMVARGDELHTHMRAIPREDGDRRLPTYLLEFIQVRDGEELHRAFYRHDGSFE